MKFRIPFAYVLLVLTLFTEVVFSQTNQKVSNGSSTQPALFPFGCNYTWTNDRPDVGLKASGNGDIPAFTAINNTKVPIVATITATPVSSSSFAYVANFNTSTVTVLNTNNNTIVKKILIGVTPLQAAFGLSGNPRNVTVNKKGDRVYVSNQAINSISIIDAQTNTLLMNVPVGQRPAGLVLSPDDQLLYVCNEDSNNVMVLDAASGNLIRTIPTDIGVRGILLNPSGSILYAAHVTLSKVSVISAGTGQLLTAVNVGRNPQSMAVTPDGKILYVANYGSESVTVVNTADHTVRTTIAVPGSPNGFAMAPDGKYLYETGIFAPKMNVINTQTNTIEYSLPVDIGPTGIAVSPDGTKVYVVHQESDFLKVIDPLTHSVSATVDLGLNGYAVSYGNFMSGDTGCSGQPIVFQITVNPTQPILTVSGVLQPMQATYGTSSAAQSFTVTGADLEGSVILQAPGGFELSTDNVNFSQTLTVGTVSASGQQFYVRLTSIAPVNSYNGDIVISSNNAQDARLVIPMSKVVPAPLSITAGDQAKVYGDDLLQINNSTKFLAIGLKNNEAITTISMTVGSGGSRTADAGSYQGVVTGGGISGTAGFVAANYDITYLPGNLVVAPAPLTITAGLVTKLYGETLTNGFSSSLFSVTAGTLKNTDQFTTVIFNYTSAGGMAASTVKNYPSAVTIVDVAGSGGFKKSNYAITYIAGDIDVIPVPLVITATDQQRFFGQANPVLTITYSGFVNNQSPAILLQKPIATTAATTTSPVGSYPITVSAAAAANYTISYIPGTLTIIEAPAQLIIPNTFTPNGDGLNDTWVIGHIEAVPKAQVSIFNRFGARIFYAGSNYSPWNGTFNGSNVPAGVYYYQLNTGNVFGILSGYLTVIR